MTFAPCDNMDELTVDRVDGNKLNNTLDNLQWLRNEDNVTKATQTSEWKHSYNYSRKGGDIEITFEDGHVEIYPNIARAVEGTGMCKKTLVRHLKHPEGVPRAHRNIKVRVIEKQTQASVVFDRRFVRAGCQRMLRIDSMYILRRPARFLRAIKT